MKIPRKLLTVLLLAIVVAMAGLAQTFTVIAGKNVGLVRQDLQRIFGSDLDFDSLEVSLFPRPGFSAIGVRVADDSRFAATPIVRTKKLVLGVNLWSLLGGRIVIDALIFHEPELQIITDEAGMLNLTALSERRKGLRKFPRMDSAAPARKPNGVSLAIREIRTHGGRIEYLDRSVQAPAELQIRNIDLSLRGFNPTETMTIRLAAALTEGLSQDVQLDGELAPQEANTAWSQRPIDLAIRFDSLYLPVIARAIAALRERLPRALNVTGPMALRARASGTIEQPKIDDFSLKIPLFGSSDYNAVAAGNIVFSERRSWATAELDGKLSVTSVDSARLRELPLVEQLASPGLAAEGAVSIFSRFAGTWETLRVGALVAADEAEVRFYDWLRKPVGVAAEIRTGISRHKDQLRFHESELVIGSAKTKFTGSLETDPIPRLSLHLNGGQHSLAAWNPLVAPSAFSVTAGSADWRLIADKSFGPDDDRWNVQGEIKLAGAELRHKVGGRKIEKLNGRVALLGKHALLKDITFRLGSSEFLMNGKAADLLEPRIQFDLRSRHLNSADLPVAAVSLFQFKEVAGNGQIAWENGHARVSGSFIAPEGSFRNISFRDFQTHLVWSTEGAAFRDLSAKVFKGVLRAEGRWLPSDEKSRRLQLNWQVDAIDANLFVTEQFPAMKDRIEGRLSGSGQLDTESGSGAGDLSIDRGLIRDFNLVRQLLLRGSGASESEETTARWPSGFAGLVTDKHTPFDSFKATFAIEKQRMSTDDLVITTPDYTVTGAGWTGWDRSTRWNGMLVLSPRLTQEIRRDYRVLRYLLDRRGRLPIPFRMEGTIPNVNISLEHRALAQLLRSGAAPREDGSDGEAGETGKPGKNWLPDALERYLSR